ncbi:hypothetical protein C4D60_Mb05t17310 [Musa balbisiana]|uniref:Uncharacterized protein n=1 Tax=Musa balbisiana TaxID=52838 RepID=A0A4S8JWT5_MUSBA|nr:hypothetical protein C4D60_Mb05t17310 [Musa balbisiana]
MTVPLCSARAVVAEKERRWVQKMNQREEIEDNQQYCPIIFNSVNSEDEHIPCTKNRNGKGELAIEKSPLRCFAGPMDFTQTWVDEAPRRRSLCFGVILKWMNHIMVTPPEWIKFGGSPRCSAGPIDFTKTWVDGAPRRGRLMLGGHPEMDESHYHRPCQAVAPPRLSLRVRLGGSTAPVRRWHRPCQAVAPPLSGGGTAWAQSPSETGWGIAPPLSGGGTA